MKSQYSAVTKNNPIRKWAKDMKSYFTEEDMWMTNNNIKASLVIRKMQINNTMVSYPYTPIRIVKIKNVGKDGRNRLSRALLLGKVK